VIWHNTDKGRKAFRKSIFFVFLLLYLPLHSIGQQVRMDTLLYNCDEELIDLPVDTLEDKDYVPADLMFIPSDVLYDKVWNNADVRSKCMDPTIMEDTIVLYLNHPSETHFIFPRPGKFLSPFGYRGRHFHAGWDVKLNLGDSVGSAWDGKVRLAKPYRGYGNVIVIRHYNGLETVYGHLSKILVKVNQDVKAGDIIGLGGRTGRATTTHLHFETRFLGEPFDPTNVIDKETFLLKSDTLAVMASLFKYMAKPKVHGNGKSGSGSTYYTVKKGDSLAKIAKRYGTTVPALRKQNGLSKKAVLKPGKKLKIR
jgi:LysM repeat protein